MRGILLIKQQVNPERFIRGCKRSRGRTKGTHGLHLSLMTKKQTKDVFFREWGVAEKNQVGKREHHDRNKKG